LLQVQVLRRLVEPPRHPDDEPLGLESFREELQETLSRMEQVLWRGVELVERLRGMPSISELRSSVIWVKGVSSYTPDYFVEMLPTSPWIHQPFEEYDTLRPDGLALVNSRYPLACATPPGSAREAHHPKGSPLCRRHGSGLPSSLTRIRSIALVYSTRPPVSVSGTGGIGPWRRSFSRQKGSPDSPPKGPIITPRP